MPAELVLPEGKLVRTTPGGTDALKQVLVDLKRYSFTGYVQTNLAGEKGGTRGYVLVIEGHPQLALHSDAGKVTEGKVALNSIMEDSYAERCSIEIHAKVDAEAIRAAYPKAVLERGGKVVQKTLARPMARVSAPAPDAEAKVRGWREAGYDTAPLAGPLKKGGAEASRALAEFGAGVVRMDALRQELAAISQGSVAPQVKALKEQAKNPQNVEAVTAGLARLKAELARERPAAAPATPTEQEQERHLQDRARQVFEMIVKAREAEGKPADISEAQVARVMEGRPTTRDERTNLIRQYTFESFVVGPSNRFAHAASVAVANSPHTAYNPLFITSGPGLGKTHLLNAIGNAILQINSGSKVVYVTAEGFSNEFKEAQGNGHLQEFREKYRSLDVALLDDAQFLSGKGEVQEELFHTFNDLYNANKQIVLTSDRPPKEIQELEDRLVSRFESGLIADIQPPEYDTRVAILRRRVQDAGVPVDEELIDYIARRVEGNIRELGGALNRVVAFSSLMGQPVSLDLAREVLKDLAELEQARGEARVAEAGRGIAPGHCYLVEEDRPEHAFSLLGAATAGEGRGLLITRSNPRRVREKHRLEAGRVLWLTERESSSVETIPPSLERIIHEIEEFMKAGGRGAVMLDGVEYLASSNSFDAVLKFLRRLVDHISESQFVLLVSVSTKTMKEQEVKNLEREMEVLAF